MNLLEANKDNNKFTLLKNQELNQLRYIFQAGFVPQLKRISPPFALVAIVYAVVMIHAFLLPNFHSHPITTLMLTAYSAILTISVVISGSLVLEGTTLQAPTQKVKLNLAKIHLMISKGLRVE